MKHKSLPILASLSLGLSLLCGVSLSKPAKETRADNVVAPTYSSLPKTINLNDTDAEDIRDYYNDLDDLPLSERTGTNLLKHLKPILKRNMEYYSYDNVWKVYEITDRDWNLSPASGTTYGSYDSTTNVITNYTYGSNSAPKNDPYVHTLYRDRTDPDAKIKNWGAHTGNNNNATNREHVWCQSRGFKGHDGNEAARGPAGTDVHHLISGDYKVNIDHHNDSPYGYVDKTKTYRDAGTVYSWLTGNLAGKPIKTSPSDQVDEVFEPRDEDKGDIARACFYMVARYNNLAGETGVISDYEPNLALADYATGTGSAEYSTDTQPVYMGIMSDLLEWNHLDPVDEYEIHRNNLIYENYQHNRNPFVDFPQWADYVWGNYSGVKAANPSEEPLNSFSTAYADSVEGFESEVASIQPKAKLRFSYEKNSTGTAQTSSFDASVLGGADITYSDGFDRDLGNGVSFHADKGSTTTRYDNSNKTLRVYSRTQMTISTSNGCLKRVVMTVTPGSGTSGKFKTFEDISVSPGTKSVSDDKTVLTIDFTNQPTSVVISQSDNATWISTIEVECAPKITYSNFSNAELQFGYSSVEIPSNAGVTAVGIYVTDDPTYFTTTAKDEGFAPSNPDELNNYVAQSKHGYASKNTAMTQSWFLGVKMSPQQYSTTIYAAAYVFINGTVTFSKTKGYSLATLLDAYTKLDTLTAEETMIVSAFKSEINQ